MLGDVATFPCQGRRLAVLGDMLELGEASAALHASVAEALDPDQIQEVYLYGDEIVSLKQALSEKYAPEHVHYFPKAEQRRLIVALQDTVMHDDLVMLKASHGLHLENVLQALIDGTSE